MGGKWVYSAKEPPMLGAWGPRARGAVAPVMIGPVMKGPRAPEMIGLDHWGPLHHGPNHYGGPCTPCAGARGPKYQALGALLPNRPTCRPFNIKIRSVPYRPYCICMFNKRNKSSYGT